MGLDMYLSATKYLDGGWSHVRNDYIHGENNSVRLVPKDPKPDNVVLFDNVIEQVVGTPYEELSKKFTEMSSATLQVRVAYWRKVNAVHRWFVDNVQDGTDDCKEYYVGREKLEELLDICRRIWEASDLGTPEEQEDMLGNSYQAYPHAKVNKHLANELLPPQSGFFFGDTELDQWYLHGIKETIDQLEALLDPDGPFAKGNGWDFEYQSSW